ncbi:hypothetical protein [Candidatus Phytoplasma pruni]|uniref:Uncharacterized protein n=1 Tax=Candidatus Phytoplasma pruni TaxID=479893 RepID=A0A851HD29_9MOLU|nr:hypothetical protein [Candidatus Phytoplasma pruni]NWN45975.1 hypothetical protein [Candidatus Phytoplasma pruni]
MANRKMPKRRISKYCSPKGRTFRRNFKNYDDIERYEKQTIKNINLEWKMRRDWRD